MPSRDDLLNWRERVYASRLERHLSIEDLATRLMLSERFTEELEEGRREVSPAVFYRLARALRLADDDASSLLDAASRAALIDSDGGADAVGLGPTQSLLGTFGGAALLSLLSGGGPDRQLLDTEAIGVIERLRNSLALDAGNIATMLSVEEPLLEAWESRQEHVPYVVIAELREFADALDILEQLFARDAIPEVIRRPASLFGGSAAIDLIRRGDLRTVAARYDGTLLYSAS